MAKKNHNMLSRIMVIYAVVFVICIAIIWSIIRLMFFTNEHIQKVVEARERVSIREVPAVRGRIYSSDQGLLATSIPFFTIRIDLDKRTIDEALFASNVKALSDSLAKLFPQKTAAQYKKELEKGRKERNRGYLVKRKITYAQLQRLRRFPILDKGQNQGGLIIEDMNERIFPYGLLAKRTIGYYSNAGGKEVAVGLEGAYNTELAGINGTRLERNIGNGIWKPLYDSALIEPQNGQDIISTIDIRIQDVAETALKKCLEENNAEYGCAILMEVQTGEIRAIANLKRMSEGVYDEVINYAIAESVEPGSTFKTAVAIAVLEEGKFDTSTKVPTGIRTFGPRNMEDSHREGYGRISFKRALEVSSNVGIATLADSSFRRKPDQLIAYLSKMHLTTPPGIEIKGEGRAFINKPENKRWSKTMSVPWMATGYEVALTPLHITTFYNGIANNGRMMKPKFIKSVNNGNIVAREIQPVVLVDEMCSQKTISKIKSILEGVVQNGTAKSLAKSPYKIAGKTGTAQSNYVNRGVEKMTYRASFVGYFPADQPAYTCMVLVGNPGKNKVYGGELAAPVFKEIADKVYATLLNITHEYPDYANPEYPYSSSGKWSDLQTIYQSLGIPFSINNSHTAYAKIDESKGSSDYMAYQAASLVMPNLKGMNVRDAVYMAEKLGLKVRVSGKGKVKKQSIEPGSRMQKGNAVSLELTME